MDMFLCSLFPTCQQLSIIKPQQTTPPTSPRFRNTRSGLRMVFIIPTKRWHLCLYKAEDAKSISGTLLLNHIRWTERGWGKTRCVWLQRKQCNLWFNSEPATINFLLTLAVYWHFNATAESFGWRRCSRVQLIKSETIKVTCPIASYGGQLVI